MVSTNRKIRDVVRAAEERGWRVMAGARGHNSIRNGPHRLTVSNTPTSDMAYREVERAIAKCEAGTCTHSTEPAKLLTPRDREARIAKDRERNERRLREIERQALTTTYTPIIRPTPTIEPEADMAPKTARRQGSTKAAVKWLRWYLGERSPVEHPKLIADGIKAGHKDPTIRKAIREVGATVQRRGPKACALVHSPVENTLEAHTPADPGLSPSTQTHRAVSEDVSGTAKVGTHARAIDREWGRLEGMAIAADAVLGKDVILAQVERLRALIEEGE